MNNLFAIINEVIDRNELQLSSFNPGTQTELPTIEIEFNKAITSIPVSPSDNYEIFIKKVRSIILRPLVDKLEVYENLVEQIKKEIAEIDNSFKPRKREFPKFIYSNPPNTKSKGPFVVHTMYPKMLLTIQWFDNGRAYPLILEKWDADAKQSEINNVTFAMLNWLRAQQWINNLCNK